LYHFHSYLSVAQNITWEPSKATLLNTVGSCLAQMGVYDMVYLPWHHAMHLRWFYPHVHKHHHRQLAPTRGTIDGINTHPFEFVTGIYLHIFSLWIIPCHAYGALLFALLTGMMASLNHTRWAVRIPYVFDVRDHDLHHQINKCNYAQYVPWWDMLLGTHRFRDHVRAP
jgi:sterol desaturase/sphingolipid hydroxylase (fatty acid hydroxylase superfamily)